MKILFISNASGYGGSERSLEVIAKQLAQTQSVTVFAENDIHIGNLEVSNIEIIKSHTGNKIQRLFNDLHRLRNEAKQADVIITNTNKAAFYVAILVLITNRIKKKKKMVFVRDFQWKFRGLIFWALKNASFYVASPAVIDYLAPYKIKPKVIPNPVELPEEDMLDNDVSETDPVIVCPAMISKWKGLEYLIRALSEVNVKCKLYILGKIVDRDYYDFLKSEADKIKNGTTVTFIEYTSEMEKYYRIASLVVNSSISLYGGPETFGRTIVEAWSFKKPVIAFSCGGPKFLIENYKDGILIDEANVNALSSAINELLDNQSLARQLGLNGYEKTINEFSSKKVAARFIEEISII